MMGEQAVLRGYIAGVVVGTLMVGAPLLAQDAPAVESPPQAAPVSGEPARPAVTPPVGAPPRSVSGILLFQRALELAMMDGANEVLTKVSRHTGLSPEAALDGLPQAEGFELPGGGVFFRVHVPGMSGTVLTSLPHLLITPVSAPGGRPAPPVAPVDASTLDMLQDPNPHYVRAIVSALTDSMLENSRVLRLGAEEFLWVGAKDAHLDPLDPGNRLGTMTFSVKGSDLAAFHQGRLTLEEARTRVIVTTD